MAGGDGDDVLSLNTMQRHGGVLLTSATLNGGAGQDTIQIGRVSNPRYMPGPVSNESLDVIGTVTVTDAGGRDSLLVDDSRATARANLRLDRRDAERGLGRADLQRRRAADAAGRQPAATRMPSAA